MTKRYCETVDVVLDAEAHAPETFRWRGTAYRVRAVLGHWREDAGYWSGGGVEIPQRDLWRVEAGRARARALPAPAGGDRTGVYELVLEAGTWRLDRVWD